MGFDERTIALLGQEKVDKLKQKNVIVFGVGGVGGYVVEMLSRCGIGKLTLVDFDVVSESNINRQIIADSSTIGKLKVDCFFERVKKINPDCDLTVFAKKVEEDNLLDFDLCSFDMVVDCIDMLKSKIALIKFCKENGVEIISSMGAGNRYQIPKFEICDISKTNNDGLARVLRQNLRKLGINHTMVCFSSQDAKKQDVIGSIAYFPAMAGINIGAYVINKFLEGE